MLTEAPSIFLVFFVISMQQQIQFNVSYYVTSSFALLPLTGTTSIVAAIVGGVIKLVCTILCQGIWSGHWPHPLVSHLLGAPGHQFQVASADK